MAFQANTTTAILIFARSSGEEVLHKKIANGNRLFNSLTKHTLKTVEKVGIPFFHFTEGQQLGDSFGERFTNAIQNVFAKGFENIITIGNDSPHLSKTHILSAVSQLEYGKSVIGPSADGGFYLMGLHRSDFKKSDFEGLSWQTTKIREEVIHVLSPLSRKIHLLPTLSDIDTFWDLELISKYTTGLSRKVLQVIRSITSQGQPIKINTVSYLKEFHFSIHFNKGSPINSFS